MNEENLTLIQFKVNDEELTMLDSVGKSLGFRTKADTLRQLVRARFIDLTNDSD